MNATAINRKVFAWIAALAALIFVPAAAHAEFLGQFGDWEAHARTDGGAKICYAATLPKKSAGDYSRRGDIYLLVSHRPADNMTGFVSLEAGYPYQEKSKITVEIGGATYSMFPDGGIAFAYEDKALVDAMVKGIDMVVKGNSTRGTLTTDTFSLKGFTAAYNEASKACGVK